MASVVRFKDRSSKKPLYASKIDADITDSTGYVRGWYSAVDDFTGTFGGEEFDAYAYFTVYFYDFNDPHQYETNVNGSVNITLGGAPYIIPIPIGSKPYQIIQEILNQSYVGWTVHGGIEGVHGNWQMWAIFMKDSLGIAKSSCSNSINAEFMTTSYEGSLAIKNGDSYSLVSNGGPYYSAFNIPITYNENGNYTFEIDTWSNQRFIISDYSFLPMTIDFQANDIYGNRLVKTVNSSNVQFYDLKPGRYNVKITSPSASFKEFTIAIDVIPMDPGYLNEIDIFNPPEPEKEVQLPKVTRPAWSGRVISWKDVEGAESYMVRLYNANKEQLYSKTVKKGVQRYDFTDEIKNYLPPGEYTCTVQALPEVGE